MAISKISYVEKALTPEQQGVVHRAEQIIDEAISQGGPLVFTLTDLSISGPTFTAIRVMYQTVGWTVEVGPHSRDGRYITLS